MTRDSESHPGDLEVVVIQRGDTGQWAFSGGMVDPGEKPEDTLKREFEEETLAVVRQEDKEKAKAVKERVFAGPGELVYKGYIDDPRNTDNAVSQQSDRTPARLFLLVLVGVVVLTR